MELQNIISAESVRELLTQARRAGWEHVVYSLDCSRHGDLNGHQHVWRRGQCQISFDLGRLSIVQTGRPPYMSHAEGWTFPTDLLDMDGLTLVLSVALTQFGGPGFLSPDGERTQQEIAILDRYHGQKSTNCAGGCCYNALKDECVDPSCYCHDTQPPSDEAREAQAAYDDYWGSMELPSYGG